MAAHLNQPQAAKAIRQAEVCHATTAYTLQQMPKDSVLALEHQVMEEERQVHQAFAEAFRVAI